MKAPASYRANGKQVLRCNGETTEHVADVVSNAWASRIAELLNLPAWLDARAEKIRPVSRWAARQYEILASSIRAQLHEEDKADDAPGERDGGRG